MPLGDAASSSFLSLLAGGLVGLVATAPFARRTGRLASEAAGAVLGAGLALAGILAAHLGGVRPSAAQAGAALALAAVVGLAAGRVARRSWWSRAPLASWLSLILLAVGFVGHTALVAYPRLLAGPHTLHTLVVSTTLLVAETATLALLLVHAYYAHDARGRTTLRRAPSGRPFDPAFTPRVAVQVTCFNEPPDMVIETLRRVRALDYPPDRLLVQLLDDSTNEATAAALREACAREGVEYVHRADRAGFKAGALNHGTRLLPPDVELLAILDADFQVDPMWLRACVGHFVDERLAFVQCPQAYRNEEESFFTRQYARQDAFFYDATMPSRNEADAVLFCGTMGIVRRRALDDAGGWSPDHVCEDAELSMRLFSRGWSALYVPRILGRGLAPRDFLAYRKQQHRWGFGNVRVARTHKRVLLDARLGPRRRMDFAVGLLHWFDGAFLVAIAAALAALSLGYAFGVDVVSHHHEEPWILGVVPVALLAESIARVNATRGGGLPGTLGMLGLWFAVKLTSARASLAAATGATLGFERTRKDGPARLPVLGRLAAAVAHARTETLVMLGLLLAGLAALVRLVVLGPPDGSAASILGLTAWLGFYTLAFACAPLYAFLAIPSPARKAADAPVVLARRVRA